MQSPDIAAVEPEVGRTHSGNAGAACAPGTMQHLAFNVDSLGDLLALRDRIRSCGLNVFGPIDHGLCQSIYFAGLENMSLEIATSEAAIDVRAWIDPEVVALAGISEEELAAYVSPPAVEAEGAPVPQPPADPAQPHMRFPDNVYRAMLAMSDEAYTARLSQPEPPVAVAG